MSWLPQELLHWLMTSWSGSNQSVDTINLKEHTWKANEYSTETLPWDFPQDFTPARQRQTCSGWRTQRPLSPGRARQHHSLSSFFPLRDPTRLATRGAMGSSSSSGDNPLNLPPRPPVLWLLSEPEQPSLGCLLLFLSPSSFHCPKCVFAAANKFFLTLLHFVSWLKSFFRRDRSWGLSMSLLTKGWGQDWKLKTDLLNNVPGLLVSLVSSRNHGNSSTSPKLVQENCFHHLSFESPPWNKYLKRKSKNLN